ncbi:hypothetical protein BC834DRAFT_1036203 [Gloeopeniophorella convolvens]|nr:hypothetical protein BC834DRAFT_1036203 [Gloeopeniophorella convolvens]
MGSPQRRPKPSRVRSIWQDGTRHSIVSRRIHPRGSPYDCLQHETSTTMRFWESLSSPSLSLSVILLRASLSSLSVDFHVTPINRSSKRSHQITLCLEITIDHAESHSGPALSSSASEPSVPGKVDDGPTRSPLSTPSAAGTVPGTPSLAEMVDRVSLPAIDEAAGQLASASAPVTSMANYAEQASGVLDQAKSIYDTWSVVLTRMRWIVDCTEKIAEIHPYAKIAWSVLSLIPKTILSQVERDENVKALVLAMHDALDLARDASAFESGIQHSAQRDILMAMLTHACDCGEFIQTRRYTTISLI